MLIGNWVGEFDRAQAERVLSGQDPFDEASMLDDGHGDDARDTPGAAPERPGGSPELTGSQT